MLLAGGGTASRFRTLKEFDVEQLLTAEQTGSIIAIAFNEFGEMLASREQGPLLLIRDTDHDGKLDTPVVFCDKVESSQGILPLNGQVFVTGAGPQGSGLYRLTDENNDGTADKVELLLKFKGPMGEHGAHAVVLGPDGLIYVVLGNHTEPERTAEKSSPYRTTYEGDLFATKYEDPAATELASKRRAGACDSDRCGRQFHRDIRGRFSQLL